jgi:hypothetical protein
MFYLGSAWDCEDIGDSGWISVLVDVFGGLRRVELVEEGPDSDM